MRVKTFGILYKPKGVSNNRKIVKDFWFACNGNDLMRLLPNGKTVRVNYEDSFKKDQDVILFMGPDSANYPVTKFNSGVGLIHSCRIVDSSTPSFFIYEFEKVLETNEFLTLLKAFEKTGFEYIVLGEKTIHKGFYKVGEYLCTLELKEEEEEEVIVPQQRRKPVPPPIPFKMKDIGVTLSRANQHALSFSEGRFTETHNMVYSKAASCPFPKLQVGDIIMSLRRDTGSRKTDTYRVNGQMISDFLSSNPSQVSINVLRYQADVKTWLKIVCPYEERSHNMFLELTAAAKKYYESECGPVAKEFLASSNSYINELKEGENLYNIGLREGDIVYGVICGQEHITNPHPLQLYNLLHRRNPAECIFQIIRSNGSCRFTMDVKKPSLTSSERSAIIARILETVSYIGDSSKEEYRNQLDFLDDETLLEQPGAK